VVHLDRVAEVWSRGSVGEPGALWWAGDHLDALVACGDQGAAKERLDAIEREFESTGRGYASVVVARGRALLAADDDVAEGLFADAVAAAEAFVSPFELGRTLLARARHRGRVGLPGAAADLARAAGLFEALGAVGWARQARGGDAGAGRASLIDQLTPAELRVAMAVARGLTNREASLDLCVSTKTIDYHLGNIYRKLGVRTRTEMTAQLLGTGPGDGVATR
jgi:DNA-binding CsgD family transcriptional regulator